METSKMLALKSLQYDQLWELNEPFHETSLKCMAKILQLAMKG